MRSYGWVENPRVFGEHELLAVLAARDFEALLQHAAGLEEALESARAVDTGRVGGEGSPMNETLDQKEPTMTHDIEMSFVEHVVEQIAIGTYDGDLGEILAAVNARIDSLEQADSRRCRGCGADAVAGDEHHADCDEV